MVPCSNSVNTPNANEIAAPSITNPTLSRLQSRLRERSVYIINVKPPNISACANLSAPGNSSGFILPNGCVARVSHKIATAVNAVNIHGGNFSIMLFTFSNMGVQL